MHGAVWCTAVEGGVRAPLSKGKNEERQGGGELKARCLSWSRLGGGGCQTVYCLFVVIPSHNGSVCGLNP